MDQVGLEADVPPGLSRAAASGPRALTAPTGKTARLTYRTAACKPSAVGARCTSPTAIRRTSSRDVFARAASRRNSDHLPGIGLPQQGTTSNVISDMEGATPGDEPETSEQYDLPDDVSAAGIAREKARLFVGRLRMEAVVEPVTLIVSELVSNAVRHGKPPIQLLLQRVGRGVRVDVHDETPGAGPTEHLDGPAALPGPDAEGGRGRFLVEALSTRHGVNEIPDDGKEVWAEIEPDHPQDRAVATESADEFPDAGR
jgi:anti-sigma regulatory factor (Ser/Thr protein kinase)